nr:immunoglobulin light chain junction region [Macaca mulatta]
EYYCWLYFSGGSWVF